MSSQKVFVQFRYCPLCQLNHKKGKKHVFAKRHQEIVTNILAKFLKKILIAKNSLQNPSILDSSSDEANITFWCYFCLREIGKHKEQVTALGRCVVDQGGILEHLTRDDHVENTVKFLKENKKDLVQTSEYTLTSNDYLKYLEVVDSKCFQYFNEKKESLKMLSQELKSRDWVRGQIFTSGLMDQNQSRQQQRKESLQPCPSTAANRSFTNTGNEDEYRRKTIQAFGDGLTPLDRENEDDTLGNIYTNALPPWLMVDDEETNSSGVIGPTLTDLEKYRKSEKKRQLPSCRVGAKFDHMHDVADSWLPSFGGVWSHGRRTNSAQQFNRRQGRKVSSLRSKEKSGQNFSYTSLQAETLTGLSPFSVSTNSGMNQNSHSTQQTQLFENTVEWRNEFPNYGQLDTLGFGGIHPLQQIELPSSIHPLQQTELPSSDILGFTVKPYVRKHKPSEEGTFQPDSYPSPFNHLHHSKSSVTINGNKFYDQPTTIQKMSTAIQNMSETSSSGSEFTDSKPYRKKNKTMDHYTADNNQLRLISTPVLNGSHS